MATKNIMMCLLFLAFCVFLIAGTKNEKETLTGNETILREIDKLLLPVSTRNITVQDFGRLAMLVAADEKAYEEVAELALLTHFKEYAHIGHGLATLHEYVKTGIEPLCPGHELAHYYVFMMHGEQQIAAEALALAQRQMQSWEEYASSQREYNKEVNYTDYSYLFKATEARIHGGNKTESDEVISSLIEAPCVPGR
ncbi:MAG TPA: hypothetical protein VJK03_02560 [Candidatus Nanoarchaeia archaeon]|nr:hypothetical protein [Candidatus Nanoarchaeia archaeon]